MPPKEFLKLLKDPKEAQNNIIRDQTSKKISFYFSDEILNYENKSFKFSIAESVEDSKMN